MRAPTSLLRAGVEPLASLSVLWAGVDGSQLVQLGERIAHGGTSDVYVSAGDDGADGSGVGGARSIIKVGRYTSDGIVKMYAAEVSALSKLRAAAVQRLVPTLVRQGHRVLPPHSIGPAAKPWPVLQLSPCGEPLESWLGGVDLICGGGGGSRMGVGGGDGGVGIGIGSGGRAGGDDDARWTLDVADAIVGDVVAALAAAHVQRIVHCDVRPSNIVVLPRGGSNDGRGDTDGGTAYPPPPALLVDWGLSRDFGAPCHHIGVAAFADMRVFGTHGTKAHPALDYVAAAYLWLYIALQQGRALWLTAPERNETAVCENRQARLKEQLARRDLPTRVRTVIETALKWSANSLTEAFAATVTREAAQLWPRARATL